MQERCIHESKSYKGCVYDARNQPIKTYPAGTDFDDQWRINTAFSTQESVYGHTQPVAT